MEEFNSESNKVYTKQIAVNMVFSVISFILNFCINFFMTPYITGKFGAEAYGFITLANDFIGYASLLSIALNSMASRFLLLTRTRGEISEAKKYFSSITLANIILFAVTAVAATIFVGFLDKFLTIPPALVSEVKLVFGITFSCFAMNILFSTSGNCYYVTNKLNINYAITMIANTLRAVIILCLFLFLPPRLSYVAIGSLVSTAVVLFFNYYYTRKLTPEFRFRYREFEWKKLWAVLTSGVWNSITKLSQIFSSGLDLLITNIMIGPQIMGYLSVAKTVPSLMASFNGTIANVFSPNLMILYAKNDSEGLKKATKTAMRFMCLFVSIPNAILITMGEELFDLWVPGQPTQMIHVLSILTAINSCVTGPTQPLYKIFTITNKVRQSSIVLIIYGFISIFATYVTLCVTDIGVYAVAGVSLIGSLVVAIGYHIPFSAKYIGLPKSAFFPEIALSVLSMLVLCAVGFLINSIMDLTSWGMWFFGAILTGIIGLGINTMLILNKEERRLLREKILCKVIR